jgi:chitodextrinase
MSGCAVKYPDPIAFSLQEDGFVGMLYDLERDAPPPKVIAPYLTSNQEVPLNNIPNADMENWSVAWTKISENAYPSLTSYYCTNSYGYSGDYFFERGSSLMIYAESWDVASGTTPYNEITISSPVFRLDHNYVTFYMNAKMDLDWDDSHVQSGYGNGAVEFILFDENGDVITQKYIGTVTGSSSGPTAPSLVISPVYLTGSAVGEDGKTWKRVTVPVPSYYVGKIVSLGFTGRAMTWGCWGYTSCRQGKVSFYVDNFYYSNSNGDEIYALEAPTAQFTYVVNGYDVAVDASISQTSGTLYKLNWTWGDGAYSEGVTATHKYTFPGNKQITLKIMNNENLVDTATLTVSVDGTSYYAGPQGSNTTNLPPIAGFSYGLTGMTIAVDGSYSKDDGTISLYSWDFDGTKKNGITATHTYANAGTKTVTLIVKDNLGVENERKITFDLPVGGVVSDTTVIDNPGIAPTAKFTYTFTTPTVTVDASGSSDDVKIETYEWDWGDGSKSVGKTSSHTYSDMGTSRKIVLTVTDNEGFTGSAEIMIVTQSYNEPADDDDDTPVVTPPTISGGSTPVTPPSTAQPFPVWGLIVFLGIVALCIGALIGGLMLLGGGKKKKGSFLGKKKGGKKK